jgi:hypothetical protein
MGNCELVFSSYVGLSIDFVFLYPFIMLLSASLALGSIDLTSFLLLFLAAWYSAYLAGKFLLNISD